MIRRILFAVLCLLAASNCPAAQIQFVTTGVGTGSIGATTFSNAPFTITSLGDTINRVVLGDGIYINHDSSSVVISGVGTFQILSGTRTFVNQTAAEVGYSRAGVTGTDLYDGPINAAFGTWDMLSSIGPKSGSAQIVEWADNTETPVTTNAGRLIFNDDANVAVTFSATIVPEPSTLALLTLGGVIAFAAKRR